MPSSVRQGVQKGRGAPRVAGPRPDQLWLPDTLSPAFAKECGRQAREGAAADADDPMLNGFLDAALSDIAGDARA